MKQLRADKANAELARDKAEKQMNETNTTMDDKVKLIEQKEKVITPFRLIKENIDRLQTYKEIIIKSIFQREMSKKYGFFRR